MEVRNAKVSFNKSGRGSLTPKVTLPMSWIKAMNISEDDRNINIIFDGDKIIIQKLEI